MSLVAIAFPQSESDLSVMLCTLEAHGIHAFVQGGGFGSLFPGPQIPWYNGRRIMVSNSDASRAREALAAFLQPPAAPAPYQWPGLLNVLRTFLEFGLFGWCIPGRRRQRTTTSSHSPKRTR